MGDGWAERVHKDDLLLCLETYQTAFDDRSDFRLEYRVQRFDGEFRWVFDTGVPRFMIDGSSAGLYLPWSKILKGSYDDDVRTTSVLTNFFGGKNLREIKPAMIEQYKARRIGAERAPATVNRELSVSSKIFTLAVRHEKADVNPCQSVERFALDNEPVRYLTEEEGQHCSGRWGTMSN